MKTKPWLSAADAARMLGVSRATLYAYVSRGFVRSQSRPGAHRERQYAAEDVERLRRKAEERKDPDKAAARALQWGIPVLESSITLIDGSRLYYRGHDAVALSRSRSVADVASLIWMGEFQPASVIDAHRVAVGKLASLPFVARAHMMLAEAAVNHTQAADLRAASVARTGWQILNLLTTAATGTSGHQSIDERLAKDWKRGDRGADIVRRTLILCADHELNVSSFTARCVASAGSHPYAVVSAGLAALEGFRHGGASARAEAMLAGLRTNRSLRKALAERLRRGERIDGFGHPLYSAGDPRATALLELLEKQHPNSPELSFVLDVADAGRTTTGEKPNLDFALAAVARVLRLPDGAPLVLFAIGRTIGWIGHAIEQYATGQLIRPRAKYVGVVPSHVDVRINVDTRPSRG